MKVSDAVGILHADTEYFIARADKDGDQSFTDMEQAAVYDSTYGDAADLAEFADMDVNCVVPFERGITAILI